MNRSEIDPPPFACFGSEKMLYDARMGPQAIASGEWIVVCWQANSNDLPGLPHLRGYHLPSGRWSEPIRLGPVAGRDHHFAPILWCDAAGLWHMLYDCHFSAGRHCVATTPTDPSSWKPAPPIAESISYPSIHRLRGDRALLVYRVEGHLGYWVYRLSDNGGADWSPPRVLLDFNDRPQNEIDAWAGSYLSLHIEPDSRHAWIGFCYWDERDGCHPRYIFKRDLLSRYHLYCLRLDIDSGRLATVEGAPLAAPVNRAGAEVCKVFDSDWELTNFPAIHAGGGRPLMILPVTENSPWTCAFRCFAWDGKLWQHSRMTETDNTWNAARIVQLDGDNVTVDLVEGHGKGEECFYGGGLLRRWTSDDHGRTWRPIPETNLVPVEGLLYNNPKPIHLAEGGLRDDAFLLYGWQGPGGIWAVPGYETEDRNRGMAWLNLDGRWV